MKKIKFKIGDWVKVTHKIRFKYNNDGERVVVYEKLPKPIAGQFVGCRYRNTGTSIPKIMSGKVFSTYLNEHESTSFISGKRVLVYMVSVGLLNKFVEASPKHVKKTLSTDTLPNFKYVNHPWSDKQKKELRKEMSDWPRNDKGQWIKKI